MSNQKESTRFGKVLERVNQEKTWEERVVAVKDQIVAEFRYRPVNTTAMVIVMAILAILTAWLIGTSIPITDPSR